MDIGAFINRNDAEKTTFKMAATRYIEEVLPSKRGKDRDIYKINRLVEEFGKYSLASISPALLSAYRDERLDVVMPQTVVHELNMISRIFKAAAMDWGIALPQGIPTDLVRKPTVANDRNRRLEPGEWELLHAALLDCKSKFPLAVTEFALETAARQSEIASLKWPDVDVKHQTARIRGVDGEVTKNGDAYRDVPLTKRAVVILSALPRTIKGKVFQLSSNAIKRSWQRAVNRARQAYIHSLLRDALAASGVDERAIAAEMRALIYHKRQPQPETVELLAEIDASNKMLVDLHFHDLRHEATSRLAEKLEMHELMKVTGHKSASMVVRYYHPRASELAQKLG